MSKPKILIITAGPAHFPLVGDYEFNQLWIVDFYGHVVPVGPLVHIKLLRVFPFVRFDEAIHLLNDAQVNTLLKRDETSTITKAALAK